MSSFVKTDAGRKSAVNMQALKRVARPEDIGSVIAFLSDRKTGRAPRATYARVARPHERGRVWNLVPGQTRGRVCRGQASPGQAEHTGLRARDAGNAGRAHRPGAPLLVSLAPLR